MAISVGDQVRSFDFESRDVAGKNACYVEGLVESIESGRYLIRVNRQVFEGKERGELVGSLVYPPCNGTRSWLGRVNDGVALLLKKETT